MNKKCEVPLKWANEEDFCKFLGTLKETHDGATPFEAWFTFKFCDGHEQRLRFLFNQESGFYFN